MASIIRQPNGRRTIQFVAGDKKRKSVRLGRISQRDAEKIKVKVESLNSAAMGQFPPDEETIRWVTRLDDKLYGKLARVGLIQARTTSTLEQFLDNYVGNRVDVKDATKINWRHTKRNLIDFFGEHKRLRDITAADAADWGRYLRTNAKDSRRKDVKRGLSGETVRKRCSNAKMFFNDAVERGLISRNPFSKLKSSVKGNRSRDYFVTREEANKVLAACPDSQWRLIFALSRFSGLRCPSEHLALTWADVDWEQNRIRIPSSKTEHHEGHESRIAPLFPEMRQFLEAVFDAAEPGARYVITKYRDTNANLRTQLTKIIRRAGLEPWPKLFQNLRSTRQTELVEIFSSHVVCAWIGNSRQVAQKHYLQVTDDHFERAATGGRPAEQKAVQNPVQQTAAAARNDPQANSAAYEETPDLQGFAASCDYVQNDRMGDAGLEPATSAL